MKKCISLYLALILTLTVIVVPAMAESVSVSDDGLVYKFKLSENVMWYGKDDFSAECTAEDFVFAFRRLVDPAMRSERAPEYYCIKNAKEINTRKITDLTQLGVEATGKYELTITLAEPCADFWRIPINWMWTGAQ